MVVPWDVITKRSLRVGKYEELRGNLLFNSERLPTERAALFLSLWILIEDCPWTVRDDDDLLSSSHAHLFYCCGSSACPCHVNDVERMRRSGNYAPCVFYYVNLSINLLRSFICIVVELWRSRQAFEDHHNNKTKGYDFSALLGWQLMNGLRWLNVSTLPVD